MNYQAFAMANARAEFRAPVATSRAVSVAFINRVVPNGGDSGRPFACCGEFASEPNELGYAFCPVCESVRQVRC